MKNICEHFNYGIHHGRVSRAGYFIANIIAKRVRKVVPGRFGRLVGEVCAIPILAPAELVSGFHNVLVTKKEWDR